MKAGWIYATARDEHEAEAIAEKLVEEKLAGCVNILPKIKSVYQWQGEIQRDQEAAMLIKTSSDRFEAVRARIRELHSYQTPCIVGVEWQNSDTDYLRWLVQTLN